MELEGKAPIDLSPPPPREPRFADPLEGEVIVVDIEVPADLSFASMTGSWYGRECAMRLQEALQMNETHGSKARCIQLHFHHSGDVGRFVSHVKYPGLHGISQLLADG